MYQANALEGLGASPLTGVLDFLKREVKAIVGSTTVTIPTPAGPITYNLGNPSDVQSLKDIATKTKVSVSRTPPAPGPVQQVAGVVEQIPGGWITVAGVGLLIAFLVGRGRRA